MEAAEPEAVAPKDGLELTAVAVEHAAPPPVKSREYSAKEARPQLRHPRVGAPSVGGPDSSAVAAATSGHPVPRDSWSAR